MDQQRILIVEDDRKIAASVKLYLEHAGYDVGVANDGKRGLEEARRGSYDLVVLDLMLPHIDGMHVCRRLREESKMPIIMLTARTLEEERVAGLETGADDYISKPFSPRELVARVRAVLRRTTEAESIGPQKLLFEGLQVDLRQRQVTVRNELVALTPTEFKLLETFVRNPGRVYSRAELVERVFGPDFDGFDRTVDAHVMNLRRKIEADRLHPDFIVTVFGFGYKFVGRRDVS